MTRQNLNFVRGAWPVALVAILAVGAGSLGAFGRPVAGPQAQTTAGQTATQQQQSPAQAPQNGRGRPDGLGHGSRGGGPADSGWPWWNDDSVRKELALTPHQIWTINKIVDDRTRNLQVVVDDYKTQETALDKMMAERVVDDATVQFQIRKLISASSEIQASRLLMIYRINKVLNDDQIKKLPAIVDRHRGRGGDPHPRPSSHE